MSIPEQVTTPASRRPRPTAAVLGAGIAGLTAAHELAERGFRVTVYEPNRDERAHLSGDAVPPVKLGGLAASQYATTTEGPGAGHARLRPFPGRHGEPITPDRAVAGEHGFRFFPAYYLHIWDTLQRIPVYERGGQDGQWRRSSRTVMDNVRRVVAQATTVSGKPSLIFPREVPRTPAELFTASAQLGELGFGPLDVQTFSARLLRYLVTSPLRRAAELENVSAYEYFVGAAAPGAAPRYHYSPAFDQLIVGMPKVLAAFDARWGDARTNVSTYLQLQLQMSRNDNKADGVLNGPTTEAWFDHWYRHLADMGVVFVSAAVVRLEPPAPDRTTPAHQRPRARVVLADGTAVTPDYVVVAVDAPTAERITAPLRAAGTTGTVTGLDGFTTSVPPTSGPRQPSAERSDARRDPYSVAETGLRPWDRFQTLAGIQYYFDTEFQLVRGHVYYAGTEWGLSSINQHGMWERRPVLEHDGHVAVLSVDIGDFNTPSRHLLDADGNGRTARDCTADEIAAEVWRQISEAITSDVDNTAAAILPVPAWYTLDRNLVMSDDEGRPVRNEAPYLVPIVGDWANRPEADPWNPNGTSWGYRSTEEQWLADLDDGHVWQARHGGYLVHHNSVVFAGTWTRTFTRMTSMEAACESGRHAVNAILDHYVWVQTAGADRRETTTINWLTPFGFLDQGFTGPVRLPSPAGDYCFVFDIENREPYDTRPLRNLDSWCFRSDLPHPLEGLPMVTSSADYTGQLLSYLQAWRGFLEQAVTPPVPPGVPTTPPSAPTPPPSATPPPPPVDLVIPEPPPPPEPHPAPPPSRGNSLFSAELTTPRTAAPVSTASAFNTRPSGPEPVPAPSTYRSPDDIPPPPRKPVKRKKEPVYPTELGNR